MSSSLTSGSSVFSDETDLPGESYGEIRPSYDSSFEAIPLRRNIRPSSDISRSRDATFGESFYEQTARDHANPRIRGEVMSVSLYKLYLFMIALGI